MEESRLRFNPELCRNESEVESKLIVQYLLPELGYTPDTWHQEVAFGSIRLDFLAFATQVLPFVLDVNSPLSLVIEAKHPQEKLDKHVYRLKSYLSRLSTKYGILTNGKELRIYQNLGNQVTLLFQCTGQEISENIAELRTLIGKDYLHKTWLRNSDSPEEKSLLQTSSTRSDSIKEEIKAVKVIAIYHNKGGVGKTTVAINLAAALRRKGNRVLVIDIDSQANTTFAAGLVKFQFEEDDDLRDRNVSQVLESGESFFVPDVVRQSDFFSTPELDVIPAHISLIEQQYRLNLIGTAKTRLVKKLQQVEQDYDFVIIDTPPSRDLYAEVALIAAHYLIIPSDLKPFANQGLSSVKNFLIQINEFREMIGKAPIQLLGVLPSKILTNPNFLKNNFPRQRDTILNHYDLPVMDTVIFDRVALSQCLNKSLTVGDLEIPDPKSIFEYAEKEAGARQSAEEFEALAQEVLEKVGAS